jgi:hypothetical protein
MKSYKAFPFLTLLACLSLCSCYHEFPGSGSGGSGGSGGGGGSTTANVSLVLVSDTLPANIGIVSLRLAISSVVLTSSTGTTSTLNTGNLVVDLARAQSDSIYLGTITGVPTGNNSSIALHLTGGEIAFFNGTGTALTNPVCAVGDVCVASFSASSVPTITSTQAISANTGFGIDVNLANMVTVTGTTLTINLTNSGTTNVVTSFALPRATSLTAGQLDLIEDFTGVATLSGTSVTVASQTQAGRGSITATVTSNTELDIDPSRQLCTAPLQGSASTCVSNNQIVSMDAILNSDGSFTAQELEPLLATPVVDTVEGTIVSITSPTQFSVVTSDIVAASSGSKIGSLSVGDPVTVNLSPNIVTGGFLVDTKGLAVGGPLGNFLGGTGTGTLFVGQTVAFPVSSFTAANGTVAAIANNVNLVTLRWSRFIAAVGSNTNILEFNITSLPGYFDFTPASLFDVQTFTNTNFDLPSSGLAASLPVGIRALYLQNNTNTADPAFFAAKVRQH